MPEVTAPKRPDCSLVMNFTGARCPEQTVRWIQTGCVHEHIKVGAACRKHARMLIEGDPLISCTACKESADPHRCNLSGRAISNEEKNRIAGIPNA